jgi:hypothetical protein
MLVPEGVIIMSNVEYIKLIGDVMDREFEDISEEGVTIKFSTGGRKSRLDFVYSTRTGHIICTDSLDREVNEAILGDFTYESISDFVVSSEIKAIFNR